MARQQLRTLGSTLWCSLVVGSSASAATAAPYLRKQLGRRFLGAGASASAAAEARASAAATPEAAGSISPFSFVLFVPSAVCGYLAYWQYQRSKWKEGLIQVRQEMLSAEPQSVYELQEMQDYRKVSCSGRYLHERSIFVGPRPRSIPGLGIRSGYFLITPLYDPTRRGAVLVNRGWVPSTWLDDIAQVAQASDARPPVPPSSPTVAPGSKRVGWFGRTASKGPEQPILAPLLHVVGVLQPSEQPSRVLPDNVPSKLEFHWIDVPALASAMGLPPDTPLVQAISEDPGTLQQTKSGNPMEQARRNSMPGMFGGPPDYPIPKNTQDLVSFTTMPQDHLVYAGIWSSLCMVLAAMARQVMFAPRKTYRSAANNTELWRAVSSGRKQG